MDPRIDQPHAVVGQKHITVAAPIFRIKGRVSSSVHIAGPDNSTSRAWRSPTFALRDLSDHVSAPILGVAESVSACPRELPDRAPIGRRLADRPSQRSRPNLLSVPSVSSVLLLSLLPTIYRPFPFLPSFSSTTSDRGATHCGTARIRLTVSQVCDDFLEERLDPRPRTLSQLLRWQPALGHRQAPACVPGCRR